MNTSHTWKDTAGCAAVLLAMLLSTASLAYVVYVDPSAVADAETVLQA